MSRTAIFGGTFNPFHIGHFEMLKCLCEKDDIDEVYLMPDRIPPHKKCNFLAEDSDRIEMCRIICRKFSKASLCLIEFEREGKSYTYDTVLRLKEKYPDKCFSFVCGCDMIMSLESWYNFELLKNEIDFIAFNRDGNADFYGKVKELTEKGVKIEVIDKKIPTVSSTEIRSQINKDLLPAEIYDYITKKGVYGDRKN